MCAYLLLILLLYGQNFNTSAAFQRILAGPRNSSVIQGGSIILRCEFLDRSGDVMWSRAGRLHHESTLNPSGRYKIRTGVNFSEFHIQDASFEEDDADWACQLLATETHAPQHSPWAHLTILVVPRGPHLHPRGIIRSDVSQNLTCEARSGSGPPPVFTWAVDGMNYTNHAVLFMKQANKLWNATSVLEVNRRINASTVTVDCSFTHPSISPKARATSHNYNVVYAPRVKLREARQGLIMVNEGKSIILRCDATANPTLITWKWYRNGELLKGFGTSELNLGTVGSGLHEVNYSCEATNRIGSRSAMGSLHVTFLPKLSNFKPVVGANLNDVVSLYCPIIGNPQPSVSWLKMPGGGVVARDTHNLTVALTNKDSFGTYKCVTREVHSTLGAQIDLVKFAAPRVYPNQPSGTTAIVGYEARLGCRIEGLPMADLIIWKVGGEPLSNDPRYSVEEMNEGSAVLISALKIANVQDTDFKEYNCTANNQYGTGHAAITLSEEAKFAISWIIVIVVVIVGVAVFLIACVAICRYTRTKSKEKESIKKTESDSQGSGSKESGQSPTTSFELVSYSSTEMTDHKDSVNHRTIRSPEHFETSSYHQPSVTHPDNFYPAPYDSQSYQLSPSYHNHNGDTGYPPDYRYPDFVPSIFTASNRTTRLSTNV